jgi:S-adenosylmethionine:tRNA ribosyltransferase-isomerase
LWLSRLTTSKPALGWLRSHGRPIEYSHLEADWPVATFQNVYADEPGSAEMASAGRPFTPELITRLVAKGVGVTPVVLHTGVASLDAGELPYPERVRVPSWTARRVNSAHDAGGRVVAVGTTVVRALESAADEGGIVRSFDGWTDLVVTAERGVRAVDGMITGWHSPDASHLLMLEAVAGPELLDRCYAEAISHGYLWHEFGDSLLIFC